MSNSDECSVEMFLYPNQCILEFKISVDKRQVSEDYRQLFLYNIEHAKLLNVKNDTYREEYEDEAFLVRKCVLTQSSSSPEYIKTCKDGVKDILMYAHITPPKPIQEETLTIMTH